MGTEWKWKMNEPEMIVNGAMENHYNMIKECRGKQLSVVLFVHAKRKIFQKEIQDPRREERKPSWCKVIAF